MAYRVRAATIEDAGALARVYVRAWRAAYGDGLLPDAYLEGLSEDGRAALWRDRLDEPPSPQSALLVAEDEAQAVAGFVLVGPTEDDATPRTTGEVRALNVDPDHWGCGAGCDLLATGVVRLFGAGFDDAVLWVHAGNRRARRFYELHSWSDDGCERQHEVMGVHVPERRYSRRLV